MADGFVFYASFYEAIEELEPEDKLAVYNAVCQYGLFGIEPECGGTVKAMFKLIKPQIDANTKRREAGRKGGEANAKQTEATPKQTEANAKQTEAKVKDKVKEKEKEKDKAKDKAKEKEDSCSELSDESFEPEADVEVIPLNDGSGWRPTASEYEELCRLYPGVNVQQEFRNMRGWSMSNPSKRKTKTGVKRFVNSWLSREQDRGIRAAPIRNGGGAFEKLADLYREEVEREKGGNAADYWANYSDVS